MSGGGSALPYKGHARIDLAHPRNRVLLDVSRCRSAQDAQYGHFNDTLGPEGWLGVLAREFCEAGNEANEHFKGRARSTDKLRAELVDVAAVAVAWIEAIDRKAAQ